MRVPVAALVGAICPIMAGCTYPSQYSQYPYQYPSQYASLPTSAGAPGSPAGRYPQAAPMASNAKQANTVTPGSSVTPVSNPALASNSAPVSNPAPASNPTPASNPAPASNPTPVSMTPPTVKRFSGIPMPANNTLDLDRTIVIGSESEWLGRVLLTTPMTVDEVVDFYRREMPHYGWAEFAATRATTTVLAYQADSRFATIQIIGQVAGEGQTQSPSGTRVEFWIVPRPASAGAAVVQKAEAQKAELDAPPVKLNLVRGSDGGTPAAAPQASPPPPPPPRPPVDEARLPR
jgi:hypothetical protein